MFGLVRMFNQVIHNAIIIIVIKKENRKDKKNYRPSKYNKRSATCTNHK